MKSSLSRGGSCRPPPDGAGRVACARPGRPGPACQPVRRACGAGLQLRLPGQGVYFPNPRRPASATGSTRSAPAGQGLCPPEARGTAVPALVRSQPQLDTSASRPVPRGRAEGPAGCPGGVRGPWGGFLDVQAHLCPDKDRALGDRLSGGQQGCEQVGRSVGDHRT